MTEPKPTRLERHTTQAGAVVAVLTLDQPPLNLFNSAMLDAVTADVAALLDAELARAGAAETLRPTLAAFAEANGVPV